MKPYQQGYLDGLCGAYAVINAVRLVSKNLTTEEWQAVFLKMLKQQIKHRRSAYFMVHGLGHGRISKIMQRIINPKFPITYSRPFRRRKAIDISEFWTDLHALFNTDGRHCAIIGYETNDYSHWSVVESMSQNRLNLFDSGGRKFINRSQCTTTEITPQTPVWIDFTATIFLDGE